MEVSKVIQVQLDRIKNKQYEEIDIRFTDILGYWRHVTIPASMADTEFFKNGIGFDGSTLKGMTDSEKGDLVLIPEPTRAWQDQYTERKTLCLIAKIVNPLTGKAFHKDPRAVARKATEYMKKSELASDSFWAPEFEFYVFDEASFWNEKGTQGYSIKSLESPNNSADPVSKGLVQSGGSGYHSLFPIDSLHDVRSEIVSHMQKAGISVKYHHHEVGMCGQCEIEVNFSSLLGSADNTVIAKHIVRNVVLKHGLTATFMPKPLAGEPGSGMHYHLFLSDRQRRIFYDKKGYCGLSKTAEYVIAGILHHAPAVCAFSNASVNSYRRLIPDNEAPVYRFYSGGNRTAAIRIPTYAKKKDQMRIEYRVPDACGNPYLSMSAILMAALDGIKKKMDPRKLGFGPIDDDVFEDGFDTGNLPVLPISLAEALDELEKDREFLEEGNVFSADLIDTYIRIKREEISTFDGVPHPQEHSLYYNL